ncbi:ADAM 17-like protease [Atta colombica]|uniref:ADAM 17-like protease n=1 Tax=Atta colombica TaxID=520822 RepID=A0A195BFG0_9HYME|nr:ADAM 17-like protease [Atta colombica]
MEKRNVLFIYCAFLTLQSICGLHRSLKYYETIHSTHFQHRILKRGIHHSYHPYNKISELEFYSHGRHFRLILTPRREVIHSNFKAYEVNADGKEKTIHLDHDNFYHGRVFGEIESHAQMHIDDGIMTGSITILDETFHIEPSQIIAKKVNLCLISLIDRVHKIYNDTLWQEHQEEDGFKGMGFVIKKIVVHSEPTRVRGGETHYNMVREKWDVRTLLEVFSREYSHKDFCLAHLFTDLKFEGGILGLAYVGSPRRNSVGGICTPEYFKNGYTLYLNSGLSSSRNHYGQRVITREADLVTAHEFGHNWGSEHDPDISECSPSASQGGSYLMYTYSVSGYDVNNKRFSPCSLRSIRKVLQAKSGRCFSEPEESFCGNLRVEGDEECDAGLLGTEDNDSCCDKNCKLRSNQGAVCSDKNSPCCQGCAYMPAGVKCRDAQYATCEQESRCTGASSECPRSPPMKDGTDCLERGQCRLGKCVPYCETQNLQSCMCDTIADACKRCCRMNLNETCFPIDQQDILPDGTPCIQGFCNKGVCEKTIQDVVERFWDIIEDININKVMRFLKDNIVGAVIIITAVIWIPASCVISYIDHRRVKESEKKWQWKHTDELIHPDEPRQVIYVGGQRQQRVQHVMHQS